MSRHLKTFCVYAILGFAVALTYGLVALALPEMPVQGPQGRLEDVRFLRDRSDIGYYFSHSGWIRQHAVPYAKGYPEEYPPLGVLYFSLPRLLADDLDGFIRVFVAQSAVCFGLLVGVTSVLLGKLGLSRRRLILLFLPATLYFSLWRFDAFPSLLVNAALLAFLGGWIVAGSLAVAAGILAKAYPVLLLPSFILWSGSTRRERRHGLIAMILFAGAVCAIILLAGGFSGLQASMRYHAVRRFEIGSIGSVLITLVLQLPGMQTYGDVAVRAMRFLLIALQCAPILYLMLRARLASFEGIVRGFLFVLLPVIIFNGFFSQQFILWFLPAYLLVARRRELLLLTLLNVVIYYEYPFLFGVSADSWAFSATTVLRTVLMAALWTINFRAMTGVGAWPLSAKSYKL